MSKERLDVLLVAKGLAPSREKAKTLILEGKVFVNGQREDKAGSQFDPEKSAIEVRGKELPYVSRGGLKLEKAYETFPVCTDGLVCMDIGASTGGFTDCMLQRGALKVYAIDSGRGQLAWKLRQDSRVISMEQTNFRYLEAKDLPELVDFATADVAFISLKKILPPAYALLKEKGEMVCLIKPQFEAGREKVGKKGVVRDPKVQIEVIEEILSFSGETGFFAAGLTSSPIKGPEGNIEYLAYLKKGVSSENAVSSEKIREIVALSHMELSQA